MTTFTVNAGFVVDPTGSNVGAWADNVTNPDYIAIDGLLCGVQAVAVAASPVTLTKPAGFTATPGGGPTQAQNAVLKLSGTVTSAVTITLPLPGYYIIDTFGLAVGSSALVTLRAVGSGEVITPPFGHVQHVYNDGTNVYFVNLQAPGTYLDYAGAAVPGWVSGCTKPPFLLCDGSAFSAGTYPILNAILGGNTLPDFRGRSGHYLNGGTGRLTAAGAGIDGNTRFAVGGLNGVTLAENQIPSLTSINTAQAINVAFGGRFVSASSNPQSGVPVPSTGSLAARYAPSGSGDWADLTSASGNNSISVTYTNGAQQIIGNAAPGVVGGIRMIRAA